MKNYIVKGDSIIIPVVVWGIEFMVMTDYKYCVERCEDMVEEYELVKPDDWGDMECDDKMEWINKQYGIWDLEYMRKGIKEKEFHFQLEFDKNEDGLIEYLEGTLEECSDIEYEVEYMIRESIEYLVVEEECEYIDFSSIEWDIDKSVIRDLRLEELGIV